MNQTLCAMLVMLLTLGAGAAAQGPPSTKPPANACAEKGFTLLIIGTYHMDNPNLDEHNVQADDVLTPRRQKEMEELVERLARFHPTKVAVEAAHWETEWRQKYKNFLGGNHTLGRNEIEQVGFRLGKRFKHTAIYPVDYPMWMTGGWSTGEIDLSKTRRSESAAPKAPAQARPPTPEETELLKMTIREYLVKENSEKEIRDGHRQYMGLLRPGDNVYIYERTDRLTYWYQRNFRIFTNLVGISAPGDRILLIIGSGHLKILRDLAADAGPPFICLENANTYLE